MKLNLEKCIKVVAQDALCLAAGIVLGFVLSGAISASSKLETPEKEKQPVRLSSGAYQYISPLLECNSLENISTKKIEEIKSSVNNLIDGAVKSNEASHVSVYFRDLNNGPWFGIDEDTLFIPGSLLKVPFMIALFNVAESNPEFLSSKIKFVGPNSDFSEYFKPKMVIKSGNDYTIDELIRRMIVYSDNDATILLTRTISPKDIEDTYTDMGIGAPQDGNYVMTVHVYASFFRILYNSTYLNKDFSEKAFKLLADSTFSDGIVAGVPKNITVAHKFGEREEEAGKDKQLHDCGIVYKPGRPYLLCVMSRGDNFDSLAKIISKISSVVYDSF